MKALLLVSVLVLAFGAISQRLKRTALTPPMVFVAVGFAVGAGLLGTFGSYDGFELTRLLSELTLIVVLFTDASRIRLRELRQGYGLPLRLLAVGMPLSIVLGALISLAMFPELSFWSACVLATILVPTDAALGQAVVSSKAVPVRIRQALNVESGLNDGLALPIVVVLAAFATMADEPAVHLLMFAAKQVTLGPVVGVLVGLVGGRFVTWCVERHWMEHSFEQLSALALAFLSFLLAELVGGNGFIAAFVAGLTLGNTATRVGPVLEEFAETEGQLLSLLTFLCFGAHLAWPLLGDMTVIMAVYAVLSLTLIRMLPVSLSLLGTGLRPMSHVFLGWFGPRGLASILFAFLVLEEGVPGRDEMLLVVVLTVLISVYAHGVTAWPGSKVYGSLCEARKAEAPAEWAEVHDLPTRLS
jgi:NhaP-type Na+/H+ or K+/H+ antiporter